jgi:hypothetical protein
VENKYDDLVKILDLINRIPSGFGPGNGGRQDNPLDPSTGTLNDLGDAIAFFQQQNFNGWSDGVVDPDKMTLREMNRLAQPTAPAQVAPPPAAPALPLDIFILFRGAASVGEQGTRDTTAEGQFKSGFNTPEYLKTHQAAAPICFVGGRDGNDKSRDAFAEALSLRGQTPNGVTIIVGQSVGGFPALNTAALLTHEGIHLDYVGISDGAFSDFTGDIVSFHPLNIRLPGLITADKKDNFFQTWGHELLNMDGGPGGFMPGTEFHGELDGFDNQDMRTQPKTKMVIRVAEMDLLLHAWPLRIRQQTATSAHVAACKDADPFINAAVSSRIKP